MLAQGHGRRHWAVAHRHGYEAILGIGIGKGMGIGTGIDLRMSVRSVEDK